MELADASRYDRGHVQRERGRRVLLLLPFPPRFDAAHGGSRVLAQVVAGLAERNRIAAIYFRLPDEPPFDEALVALCDRVDEVCRRPTRQVSRSRWRRRGRWAWRLVWGAARRTPHWAALYASRAFAERIHSVCEEWHPDVAQVEFHVLGQYGTILRSCGIPTLLVQHEPGTIAARDELRRSAPLRRQALRFEAFAWERYERNIMRHVDAVVTFTEHDRQALLPLSPPTPIVTIPLGSTIPDHPLDPAGYGPPSLVFIGNFHHPPNTDAALRLVFDIFPGIRNAVPDAHLYVVGDHPPSRLWGLPPESGITVTGWVPDVTPFLDQAAVVVAPLRSGGGMRVKVLEALAAGKAVVASRLALEGLGVGDQEQVVVAETDDDFVHMIVHVLNDETFRVSVARRAREWAEANLSWSDSIRAYEKLYDQLTTQRENGSAS